MRSHEEIRWRFEKPTQSRISPSILEYTKKGPGGLGSEEGDSGELWPFHQKSFHLHTINFRA